MRPPGVLGAAHGEGVRACASDVVLALVIALWVEADAPAGPLRVRPCVRAWVRVAGAVTAMLTVFILGSLGLTALIILLEAYEVAQVLIVFSVVSAFVAWNWWGDAAAESLLRFSPEPLLSPQIQSDQICRQVASAVLSRDLTEDRITLPFGLTVQLLGVEGSWRARERQAAVLQKVRDGHGHPHRDWEPRA